MHKKVSLFINLPYSDPPQVKKKEISSFVLPVSLSLLCLQDTQQASSNTCSFNKQMQDLKGETLPS